jgi:two-component system, OmpR family, KDP operon response regulator KdpE
VSRILVVDDDRTVGDVVARYLQRDGHDVAVVADGLAALRQAVSSSPDLVILDLMLPGLSGLEVFRKLQEIGPMPVIMLTARTGEGDRVAGLELGADDYVTKPFSIQELLARVRAHLRRAPERISAAIEAGDFLVDPEAHTVELQGRPIHLTPTEFDLLLYLARQAGKVVTHRALLKEVWGPQSTQQNEYLRVFIGQLRKKLEAESGKQYIQTEPWVGYRFVPEGVSEKDEGDHP